MSYLGDTLTVGLILVLVFGSLALYLYTRIQQTEQKVSLLESIVLDLKLSGELPVFGEFPSSSLVPVAASSSSSSPASSSLSPVASSSSVAASTAVAAPIDPLSPVPEQEYTPFVEEEEDGKEVPEERGQGGQEESILLHPLPEESPYDHMTLKELQGVIRARGLPSEKGAKKQTLIDILKRADQALASEIKPSSPPSSAFLESSSLLSEDVPADAL